MYLADLVFCTALAFVIGCNIYFGPRLTSDRIAMQWDLNGRATWYAPKWVALWGIAAFMVAVRFLIWVTSIYAPASVHGVQIGIILFSLTFAAAHVFTLLKAR
jgi:hypothetical protein